MDLQMHFNDVFPFIIILLSISLFTPKREPLKNLHCTPFFLFLVIIIIIIKSFYSLRKLHFWDFLFVNGKLRLYRLGFPKDNDLQITSTVMHM